MERVISRNETKIDGHDNNVRQIYAWEITWEVLNISEEQVRGL